MVDLSGKIEVKLGGAATARMRTNLALHHLFAACRFAARVGDVESQFAGQPLGGFWEEILHNSLGVATLTVASLEGYANELYFESSILTPALNPVAAADIAELIDSENILRKYAIALAVRTGKHLNSGVGPVQNADALVKLRNAVVHFRPEWLGEQDKHDKLSKLLQHQFQTSPFLPGESAFPRAWASHDFTKWALRSTVAFLDHFFVEAALDSPLAKFRANLTELSGNVL